MRESRVLIDAHKFINHNSSIKTTHNGTGCGLKCLDSRGNALTLGFSQPRLTTSAAHAPYTRVCAA